MPKRIAIEIGDDMQSLKMDMGGMTLEASIMVLYRALRYQEARFAAYTFHQVTAEMVDEQRVNGLLKGKMGPGGIIQP